MLTENMKKGNYVLRDSKTAQKILRVKKHPEYSDESVYILQGIYGIEIGPYEVEQLKKLGFNEVVTAEELNQRFKDGKYFPPNGKLRTA